MCFKLNDCRNILGGLLRFLADIGWRLTRCCTYINISTNECSSWCNKTSPARVYQVSLIGQLQFSSPLSRGERFLPFAFRSFHIPGQKNESWCVFTSVTEWKTFLVSSKFESISVVQMTSVVSILCHDTLTGMMLRLIVKNWMYKNKKSYLYQSICPAPALQIYYTIKVKCKKNQILHRVNSNHLWIKSAFNS